jgi:hypothetical protein
MIAAALGIGVHLRSTRPSVEYLDAVAFGLPLGIAIGRIGDVINGEHYGPATDFFLGDRNTHPDADVPDGLRHGCARSAGRAVDQPRPCRHRSRGGDAHDCSAALRAPLPAAGLVAVPPESRQR